MAIKISNAQKGVKETLETRKKTSEVMKQYYEDNPEKGKQCRANQLKHLLNSRKQTSPERIIDGVLTKLDPQWEYCGTNRVINIGNNFPDFIHKASRRIIEVYGDYWHRNDNPKDKIDLFKAYGYDTLILWEGEIKNNLDSATEKIKQFCSLTMEA
jgi:very-short-patch-repair endonuclease